MGHFLNDRFGHSFLFIDILHDLTQTHYQWRIFLWCYQCLINNKIHFRLICMQYLYDLIYQNTKSVKDWCYYFMCAKHTRWLAELYLGLLDFLFWYIMKLIFNTFPLKCLKFVGKIIKFSNIQKHLSWENYKYKFSLKQILLNACNSKIWRQSAYKAQKTYYLINEYSHCENSPLESNTQI